MHILARWHFFRYIYGGYWLCSRSCGWFPVDGKTYYRNLDCNDPRMNGSEDNTTSRELLLAIALSLSICAVIIVYAYSAGIIK